MNNSMGRVLAGAIVLLSSGLGLGVATAQPVPAQPVTTELVVPAPLPPMLTLDRTAQAGYAGLDLGLVTFTGADGQLLRFEAYGQHMISPTMGIYGALPISWANIDFGAGSESDTSINNLDVGGVFLTQLDPETQLIIRGGVVLPTHRSDDNLSLLGSIGGLLRLGDLALAFPEMTALRASASPIWQRGHGFVRGDVGLDVPIHVGGSDDTPNPIGRLSVAGGGVWDTVVLAGEMVTIVTTEDDASERFLHTLAATARYTGSNIQPHFAFVIPMDDSFSQFLDLTLLFGATMALP